MPLPDEEREDLISRADENLDINKRASKALNTESLERGRHLLRVTALTMPNSSWRHCTEYLVNESLVAAFADFDPQDECERLLCTQLLVIHDQIMDCFLKAGKEGTHPKIRDMELKHAEKLMAIELRYIEALDKHRGKGRQKITVEHVAVHDGGKAIVGTVDVHESEAARGIPPAKDAPPALTDESAASADGEKLAKQLKAKNLRPRQRVRCA